MSVQGSRSPSPVPTEQEHLFRGEERGEERELSPSPVPSEDGMSLEESLVGYTPQESPRKSWFSPFGRKSSHAKLPEVAPYEAPRASALKVQGSINRLSLDAKRYLIQQGILGYDHGNNTYYLADRAENNILGHDGLIADLNQPTRWFPRTNIAYTPDAKIRDEDGRAVIAPQQQRRAINVTSPVKLEVCNFLEELADVHAQAAVEGTGFEVLGGIFEHKAYRKIDQVRPKLEKDGSYLAEAWRLKDKDLATLNKTEKATHVITSLWRQTVVPFQAIWKSEKASVSEKIIASLITALTLFPVLVGTALAGTVFLGIPALIGKLNNVIRANPQKAKRISKNFLKWAVISLAALIVGGGIVTAFIFTAPLHVSAALLVAAGLLLLLAYGGGYLHRKKKESSSTDTPTLMNPPRPRQGRVNHMEAETRLSPGRHVETLVSFQPVKREDEEREQPSEDAPLLHPQALPSPQHVRVDRLEPDESGSEDE